MEVLHQRYGQEDARYAFNQDVGSLMADSGPAVVAFLTQHNVLAVQEGPSMEDETSPELECALRAAAVVGCQALAQQLGLPMGGVGAALARRRAREEGPSMIMKRPSTVAW